MQRLKAIVASSVLALSLAGGLATASDAATGYRGSTVHGCTAYIDGSNAWTNCNKARRTMQVRTKAWCTAQPVRYGTWRSVSKNSKVTGISEVGCSFNVHTAQAQTQ